MTQQTTLLALASVAILTACAGPGGSGTHAGMAGMGAASPAHHPAAAPASSDAMQERMKLMQGMHEKMKNAKTPEERQALMAEHMKAMEGGMAMMRGMQDKAMPMDPAQRQKMMEQRMDMMQSMMDMMMQRMPGATVSPPVR